MIRLAVEFLVLLGFMYVIGGLSELQEGQADDLNNHEDRLDALEDYADYIRDELLKLKRRENADDDRADNYVRWRRKP